MGKLDELFGKLTESLEVNSKSDLDRLEAIEEFLSSGDFGAAMNELEKIKKEENLYVGAVIFVRALLNPPEDVPTNRSMILDYLTRLLPVINGIENWRYRALALSEVAMAFYHFGDEFNGDLALKSSLNLAKMAGDEVLSGILRELIKRGLIEKAAYAFSLVKDRKRIDFLLSQLVEVLYLAGEFEKADAALAHIRDPFYKAIALYNLALVEASRDKETALAFVDNATRFAEEIENKNARIELLIKLSDLRAQLTGKGISLAELIQRPSSSELPEHGEHANDENQD
jgi:hypothetical protein